jgi:hypothetical protein
MRHRKKTVLIAGDSIVKNIVGAKMSGNDSKYFFMHLETIASSHNFRHGGFL